MCWWDGKKDSKPGVVYYTIVIKREDGTKSKIRRVFFLIDDSVRERQKKDIAFDIFKTLLDNL